MRMKKGLKNVRHRGCGGKLNFAPGGMEWQKLCTNVLISNPRQENCRARLYVSPKIFVTPTTTSFTLAALSGYCWRMHVRMRGSRYLDLVNFSFLEHFWWNLRLLQIYKATVLEKDVSSMYNMAIG